MRRRSELVRAVRLVLLVAWLVLTGALIGAQEGRENNLVYEIFVRSFADSNGDGIGDLNGITTKLDAYLNDGRPETDHDLEVGVLWLMPVFPSTSYHGYDVTDFRAIHPDYGSLSDFRTLLTEAHRRGVRVILDLPLNHTSRRHPWFTEALNDPTSPHRAFYRIADDTGPLPDRWHRAQTASGAAVRYFGLFDSSMPDLVFDHAPVRAETTAIAKFWLDLGVDGFRLDAAKHIFGDHFEEPFTDEEIARNNVWWQEFSRSVYTTRSGAILIGEVLGSRETMRRHAWGLDGLLDEGFMNEVRAQLAEPTAGLIAVWQQFEHDAGALNRAAYDPALPFPDQPFHTFPFVGSHDRNPRLASELEDLQRQNRGPGLDPGYRLALYVLLGLARHPVWYAGDELMQRGWKWHGNAADHPTEPGDGSRIYDETLREPFPWFRSGAGPGQTTWFTPRFDRPNDGVSREEQDQPGGMLHLFRGITNLRTRHPALANGDIGAVLADTADWLVVERVQGSSRYLLLINRTAAGHDYRFHDGWFPQYAGAQVVFSSDGARRTWADLTADNRTIDRSAFVPSYGVVVLRAR
jgi:alpha-amylase